MRIETQDTAPEGPTEPLPERMIDDLARRELRDAAAIQTHISHLFLTSDRVYKIRKAARFPFLCFASRAERNADCLREVELNRRLAPDVYLGVAPIELRDGHFCIGPIGEEIPPGDAELEHCVVMRRLPDGCDAQSQLERSRLTAQHVDAVATTVAAFHESHRLGTPAPWSREAWRERVESPVAETMDSIREHAANAAEAERAGRLHEQFHRAFAERGEAIERRRLEGRAVDGHGDLQLAHVWFEPDRRLPAIIDCTEFNEDFRKIDAASEVAFHAMDLIYRGAPEYAERFLAHYAAACDDFDLYAVVDPLIAYRSAVRAKVALLAATDPSIAPQQRDAACDSAQRHLDLAERRLVPREPGALVVVCGTVGSGKSTLARAFADACQGVVIGSDRTRKRLAGLPHDDHSQATSEADVGLYAREVTETVYAALLERADAVVGAGRTAILDASYTARTATRCRAHVGQRTRPGMHPARSKLLQGGGPSPPHPTGKRRNGCIGCGSGLPHHQPRALRGPRRMAGLLALRRRHRWRRLADAPGARRGTLRSLDITAAVNIMRLHERETVSEPWRTGRAISNASRRRSRSCTATLGGSSRRRKPVALWSGGVLRDFRSVDARRLACEREAELDRILAPETGARVIPVVEDVDGELHFLDSKEESTAAHGTVVDWALRMRRLRDGDRSDRRLAAGTLDEERLARVARRLATAHERAWRSAKTDAEPLVDRLGDQIGLRLLDEAPACETTPLPREVAKAEAWQRNFFESNVDRLRARIATNSIRIGHGELGLDHVFIDDEGEVHVLAGLEMLGEELRETDPIADLALFTSDLAARDHVGLAERFLADYARLSGDFDFYPLVDFYASLRAIQRGKLEWFAADLMEASTQHDPSAAAHARARSTRLLQSRDDGT